MIMCKSAYLFYFYRNTESYETIDLKLNLKDQSGLFQVMVFTFLLFS